ncbi:ABC transporter permease, partial [Klebsiella pneumoniae]|uniref:ABC transporter permease n=1 Tax=Klebsiella pneumoniae TaxID=573 RepID=UPI001E3C5494
NTVFTDIAASAGRSVNLTGDGPPEYIIGRRTTASFWSVLGTQPLMGRAFTDEEDRKSAKVAVISYSLWQRRFGGDSKMIGRKIILSDEPYEVIGIMPSGFVFPNRLNEIWTPASMSPEELA